MTISPRPHVSAGADTIADVGLPLAAAHVFASVAEASREVEPNAAYRPPLGEPLHIWAGIATVMIKLRRRHRPYLRHIISFGPCLVEENHAQPSDNRRQGVEVS